MVPQPKRKHSSGRRDRRRSQDTLDGVTWWRAATAARCACRTTSARVVAITKVAKSSASKKEK